MESNNLVSKISIETHSRTTLSAISDTYTWDTYAKATGILVKNPNMNVDIPEISAVAVMRSRFTTWTQRLYSVPKSLFCMQVRSMGSRHTQVPPVSDKIDALTDMIYALVHISITSSYHQAYLHRKERCYPSPDLCPKSSVLDLFLMAATF
jgi:hypothetical protein